MARVGDVIENPAMGGSLEFRRIDAALLEFDLFLGPGGVIFTEHVHPHQVERFEVLCGAVQGHVERKPQTVTAGGSSVVTAGVAHAWWNAVEHETHLRVQFRPALNSAEMIETAFALARDGRTDQSGVPRFPHSLGLLLAFPDEFRPARMPVLAHRIALRALPALSQRLRIAKRLVAR